MTWRITPAPPAAKIEVSYSVGGYMQGGFDKIAPAVNAVLGEQVNRLKNFIETGETGRAKGSGALLVPGPALAIRGRPMWTWDS